MSNDGWDDRGEATHQVGIEVEYEKRVNYALQQNDVPFVRTIRIHNEGDLTFEEIDLHVWGEPGVSTSWQTKIAKIPTRSTYRLQHVDISLSPEYLINLTERESGLLHVQLGKEQEQIYRSSFPFELLAYNEWGGSESLPEILAAFVFPNHPAIQEVLTAVRDKARELTGDPSLSGYQIGGPERVNQLVDATYRAIQDLDISYINPPASFEQEGQKIRTPDQIRHTRMGTCLDLASFVAACLEQMGLHPLVFLIKGHAFVGVWLVEECFHEPCVDDVVRIRKRSDFGHIVAFESTALTSGKGVTFERAARQARGYLQDEERFLYAVDIKSARNNRIRPVRIRTAWGSADLTTSDLTSAATDVPPSPMEQPTIERPKVPEQKTVPEEENGELLPVEEKETPPERVERWKRKLLDLSLRNRLLNFKETKKTFQIYCPDLPRLEDLLAGNESFRVFPRPQIMDERDPRDPQLHMRSTGTDPAEAFLLEEMEAKRLHTSLTSDELDRRLIEIYREERSSLEEGGVNTLYIAIGFLKWYESETSDQGRLAPLILLPLELQRSSIREGFRLSLLDEEPRINVTLLRKLETDFGLIIEGLDPLPADDSGIDIQKVFHVFREKILEIDRWEVQEIAYVGHFSFTKFLLWHDLEKHFGKFLENSVIKYLVERPSEPFSDGTVFPDESRLDEEYSPENIYCPLDADSSQLASVMAATRGKNFVLEGPPGTGKSQTITNIIAQCLAEGKRVLFVSEKMAALNVVHHRLSEVGLGPFCLELHSNKTDKRKVLAQLEESLRVSRTAAEAAWERKAKRLAALRESLNKYVQALGTDRVPGGSAFHALSKLIAHRDTPHVPIDFGTNGKPSVETWNGLNDTVKRLIAAAEATGEVAGHPWRAANLDKWSLDTESEIKSKSSELTALVRQIQELIASCADELAIPSQGWSRNDLETVARLANLLLDSPVPPETLLSEPQWDVLKNRIESWIAGGKRRNTLRAGLFETFREDVLQTDLIKPHQSLEKSLRARPPLSWFHSWRARRRLKEFSHKKKLPRKAELLRLVEDALAINEEQSKLDKAGNTAMATLGMLWQDGEADWEQIQRLVDWTEEFRSLWPRIPSTSMDSVVETQRRWMALATSLRSQIVPDSGLGQRLNSIREQWKTLREIQDQLRQILVLDTTIAWGKPSTPNYLDTVATTLATWISSLGLLPNWCGYERARKAALDSGLGPLIDTYERGDIASADLYPVFEHSFYRWWYQEIVRESPELENFYSPDHRRKIREFRSTDDEVIGLSRSVVHSRLSEKVPNPAVPHIGTSELGILRKEIKKKRRHLSVRTLCKQLKTLLPRIKPCFLMSPLSVAQFLDVELPPFDVVVFDEASQIPVWDAIGAIGRGSQVIVVGDSKQLPPTNFFQKVDEQDEFQIDDEPDLDDLESILDETVASGLPQNYLKWHYRSRHENLIAFSNYHYYGNRLITFPSAEARSNRLGVEFRYLENGIYDKGRSRTNKLEAEAVVDEVVRRLRDPGEWDRSIGIVTFNLAQQRRIEDLLEKARRDYPEIDRHFSYDSGEPVFVKNLENVQGDERDVIMLSVCYGPDQQGRVSMNFGPLNREGGERRLNVAITRAREQALIFASLRSDQIDLSRTRSVGVEHLKTYLDYAERGPQAIAEAVTSSYGADFESPFEQDVHRALTDRGWTVHSQVGCSGYRIDLAVCDPENPGRYILGIECDGAMYHSTLVARDRDRLREHVLRGLGWNLHRIWSTDWFQNRGGEIIKIEKALREAARESKASSGQTHTQSEFKETTSQSDSKPEKQPPTATFESALDAESESPVPLTGMVDYKPYSSFEVVGNRDSFYESKANNMIRRQIANIVEAESPVPFSRVVRYISQHWDISRASQQIQDRIVELIPKNIIVESEKGKPLFLWKAKQDPSAYREFRVSEDGSNERSMDEIAPQEIANAAWAILEQQISLPRADLVRETARCFGFKRVAQKSSSRIERAVEILSEQGRCVVDGESVRLP